jgi:hypothetical protein
MYDFKWQCLSIHIPSAEGFNFAFRTAIFVSLCRTVLEEREREREREGRAGCISSLAKLLRLGRKRSTTQEAARYIPSFPFCSHMRNILIIFIYPVAYENIHSMMKRIR